MSFRNFVVLALTFRPLIHLILTYVYGIRVQLCSFQVDIHVPKTHFVEETVVFPVEWSWEPCWKITWVLHVWRVISRLSILFHSFICLSLCHTKLFWLPYLCNMFWNLEVWDSPSFLFFSKIVYGYSGSTESPHKCWHWFLYFNKKCCWDFGMDSSKSVDHFGYCGHCKDDQIFQPMNLGSLSLYLCLLFLPAVFCGFSITGLSPSFISLWHTCQWVYLNVLQIFHCLMCGNTADFCMLIFVICGVAEVC